MNGNSRAGFDVDLPLRQWRMFQRRLARDGQVRRPPLEQGHRHGIAEHVVQPAQFFGLGIDFEAGGQQMLVKRLARAHHDAMLTQRYRRFVAIISDMADRQQWHGMES